MKMPWSLRRNRALAFVAALGGLVSVVPLGRACFDTVFSVSGLAASADGTKLVAVYTTDPHSCEPLAPIYLSNDSGATWTPVGSTSNIWQAVATSADGTKLVAAASFYQYGSWLFGDGLIYTSADSGANWRATSAPCNQWASVVSSANGLMLAAAASSGAIYYSRDAGATWLQTIAPSNVWVSLACSADGTKLVAAGQQIYTSTDSGSTWTPTSAPSSAWAAVASSADGTRLLAAAGSAGTGLLYVSSGAGASWITTGAPSNHWVSVAASAEGTRLGAAAESGIFTSTDSGSTWTAVPGSNLDYLQQWEQWGYWARWTVVASSADGGRVAAAGLNDLFGFIPANPTILPNPNAPSPFLTLPYSGPWRLADVPAQSWDGIVSSGDGSRLVASGASGVYSSADAGATWVALTNAPRQVVAASVDGRTLVAITTDATYTNGAIYISADSGLTWRRTSAPDKPWVSAACSADATKLVATADGAGLWTSTNAGATWVGGPQAELWGPVASSADGTRFVAASFVFLADVGPVGGPIFVSTNSGASWSSTSSGSLSSMAMSADGTQLVAATADLASWGAEFEFPDGFISISHDGGATWTGTQVPGNDWTSVAISSDGAKLVAAGPYAIYVSTDHGATWVEAAEPFAAWNAITCSADGSHIAAAGDGLIAILRSPALAPPLPPLPRLTIELSAANASLMWLVPSSRFVLQENAGLTSANWVDVTNQPTLNFTNLHYEMMLPAPPGKAFYRLKQQ